MLDGVTAMLLVQVEAGEGAKQVRDQELLQGWLVNPHVLVAEAPEQHDIAVHGLPSDLLNAPSRPVKLIVCCHPLLELPQLQAEHHPLGKIGLELLQPISLPAWQGLDGGGWQGGWQWEGHLHRAWVDIRGTIEAEQLLWQLLSAELAWVLQLLHAQDCG